MSLNSKYPEQFQVQIFESREGDIITNKINNWLDDNKSKQIHDIKYIVDGNGYIWCVIEFYNE